MIPLLLLSVFGIGVIYDSPTMATPNEAYLQGIRNAQNNEHLLRLAPTTAVVTGPNYRRTTTVRTKFAPTNCLPTNGWFVTCDMNRYEVTSTNENGIVRTIADFQTTITHEDIEQGGIPAWWK